MWCLEKGQEFHWPLTEQMAQHTTCGKSLLGKSNFSSSGPRGHYLNESFGDLSLVNHLSGLWAGWSGEFQCLGKGSLSKLLVEMRSYKTRGLTQMRTRTGLREPKPVPAGFTKARSDWPLQGLQGHFLPVVFWEKHLLLPSHLQSSLNC